MHLDLVNKFKDLFLLPQLHRKLVELIYAFLKVQILAIYGPTWWRIPGKTTDLKWMTTTLPQALAWITEVTRECVIH